MDLFTLGHQLAHTDIDVLPTAGNLMVLCTNEWRLTVGPANHGRFEVVMFHENSPDFVDIGENNALFLLPEQVQELRNLLLTLKFADSHEEVGGKVRELFRAPPHEVSTDGTTVWVNSPEVCLGRFGRGGIDVHGTAEEQLSSGTACHDCGPVPDWDRFVSSMYEKHSIAIPPNYKPAWVGDTEA